MSFLETILSRSACLVGSEWVAADSGETIDVNNPATGEIIGSVPKCGRQETARAVQVAAASFAGWRARTAIQRADVILRWRDLIVEHQEELARLMTMEQGKPLAEARGEVAHGAGYLRWFAEEARRVYGEIVPPPVAGRVQLVTRNPVGVVGIITPWNFPLAMIARKIGPALAVGCPSVIKPASQTPFSALALAELAMQAGVPEGVINVVTGDARAIGAELTENPTVRKISFTGSTEVGKVLLRQCAGTVKKVSMELGGNAPFIIFDDADLDRAVAGAAASKFRNSGQTCVCANRFYVQDGVYDAFVDKFCAAVAGLKVGNGLEDGVDQGPLIDRKAVAHVESQIADAVARGGRIVIGGKRHELGGNFFEPTVIADATSDMSFARDETFGPIAPIFRFADEAEAVVQANDTNYGLAAYLYTRSIGRAFRVSEALEYGLVGVNEGMFSSCEAPFGGVKESGLGREGSHHGIDDYVELKSICMGLGD
ncbi:succinate-semialdehyde dehydrogenase (NADP(+)) [Oceanidesulfovibrio indonesiensis]|uniref:Succinate-semialdehyde dehydrogenase (NADP(+)) n=1 Tax=Oceanidesulfovibrio indonesiensis TaxID=54767 RepID=A0A7M3MDN1_9BACT|nr:NAD-dependent succinate-semialdehyde dehydrogenase [Oceanidesulfovibrio indonesiensis]TVM16386.1 succinate-semialdehyde dehydrogenase (NADP(+)) [Oceanidesulfovibrio indonesiensis]